MNLLLIGLSHKTAPIEMREQFAMNGKQVNVFGAQLEKGPDILEKVIVSTCNRTEIYIATESTKKALVQATEALGEFSGVSLEEFEGIFYSKTGAVAVQHLFKVSAGMDSMALGETEILGQVKDAYLYSHSQQWTKRTLNTLFQKALQLGKKVRTETEIGKGKVSIASISVDLSKKIFHRLDQKKVLLIGSGQVARQVCEALSTKGVKNFIVANRNVERAEALVQDFGGQAVPFEGIDEWAPKADIIIASAGSPKAFIHPERVQEWSHAKTRASLFLIDLGVPRNIESDVTHLSDVYLYNLDDLKIIADKNLKGREGAAESCMIMVDKATQHYLDGIKRTMQGDAIESNT